MDIKDYILIGGGLLIAAVIAHGFWIAWQARRQDLRIDIKPDLFPADIDELERLRGELPNGGSRLSSLTSADPTQVDLDLNEPEIEAEPPAHSAVAPTITVEVPDVTQTGVTARRDPIVSEPAQTHASASAATATTRGSATAADRQSESRAQQTSKVESRTARVRVAEVSLPAEEPPNAERTRKPRRLAQRRKAERAPEKSDAATPPAVEELIVMYVLAETGRLYTGDELFAVLKGKGLKFGEMNIFHCVEPLTKAVHYSIANLVEPGTFDMADMESLRSPGLCLFMQLPGPEQPAQVFENMLAVAREVAGRLGGEIKDEQRNVMTPQTVEHYRQRIVDFSRRRMSKRA